MSVDLLRIFLVAAKSFVFGHNHFEGIGFAPERRFVFLPGYFYFDDEVALQKAFRCWEFIKRKLVERKQGEWYWSVHADGSVNTVDDRAGFWKCPYHNGRMCMEVMERFA